MDGLLDIDRTPVKSLIFRKWMVYTRQSYIKVDDLTIESISISWMVYIMEHPMENSTIHHHSIIISYKVVPPQL